jgi:hypothetical protein
MEPNGFAIPTSPRTLGFSCSRVELPLPTHMRCQSLADRTPLLAQEETLLDLTAPVRALSAYLRNHSQGRRSRFASTPSASNLLVRGPLLCIRTRLQKRAESATGRTLSLASADVLVQIRTNLHFCFVAPHSPFLPPRGPWSARTWPPPNSSRIVPSAAWSRPLLSPQRSSTSSTRGPAALVRIHSQPPYCSSSRTA